MQPCNDDEYIGAALGFAQELARYALSRGCEVSVLIETLDRIVFLFLFIIPRL